MKWPSIMLNFFEQFCFICDSLEFFLFQICWEILQFLFTSQVSLHRLVIVAVLQFCSISFLHCHPVKPNKLIRQDCLAGNLITEPSNQSVVWFYLSLMKLYNSYASILLIPQTRTRQSINYSNESRLNRKDGVWMSSLVHNLYWEWLEL
jgi:hypothetical protein